MFEILIQNGTVVDGSGKPRFSADVGIIDGRISAIGDLEDAEASRTLDATNLVVCPGFVDIHTHSDLTILADPKTASSVQQGVTTEAVGQCGFSAAPSTEGKVGSFFSPWTAHVVQDWKTFDEYLNALVRTKVAHNVLSFVGHSTIRSEIMGYAEQRTTPAELHAMERLVADCMEQGAFGLSSGLEYLPGANADHAELLALCSVVKKYGGLYASHIRNMNEGVVEATRELMEIGRECQMHVHHSHIGAFFPAEEKMDEILGLMEATRESGVEVTGDATLIGVCSTYDEVQQRPSGYTTLDTILPPWALEGGTEGLRARLEDSDMRRTFKSYRKPKFRQILSDGWDSIYLFECQANRELINRSFSEIAAVRGCDPYDAAFDIMREEIAATGNATVFIVAKTTTMENVRKAVCWSNACIVSDSFSVSPVGLTSSVNVQPNAYGNYPCFMRKYVYQENWVQLEEAIWKCTLFPATVVGIKDRGMVSEGWCADVTVFDPNALADRATYEEPKLFPEGIRWVIVNGELVVADGVQGDSLPGKVLRHV